jgi:peptidoglycan/LPS O-acetylase OafA/YrhL
MDKANRVAQLRRIPSLDGIRAVSIAMVFFAHLCGTRGFFSKEALRYTGDTGALGVKVFFVLSGFLITTLLLDEIAEKKQISLKRFYLRRSFRILPAAYAYIAVIAAANALTLVTLRQGQLFRAVTFTIDYVAPAGRSWYLGHLWSLAVEEQFYLLWPLALRFAGVLPSMRLAAVTIAATPAIRALTWFFYPTARTMIPSMFHTVSDSMACGCLLAGTRDWLWGRPLYRQALQSRWFFLVPCLAGALNVLESQSKLFVAGGETVINIAAAITIDRMIRVPGGIVGKWLNSRPLVFAGVLSYSLYLWQQPFLHRKNPGDLTMFPVNVIFAVVLALMFYNLIEKPFLRLRRRMEGRQRALLPGLAAKETISC